MKNILIFIVIICMTSALIAQKSNDVVEKGTVLTLGAVSAAGINILISREKTSLLKEGQLQILRI